MVHVNTEGTITEGKYGGIVFTQGSNLQTTLASIKLVYKVDGNGNAYPDISFNPRSVNDALSVVQFL